MKCPVDNAQLQMTERQGIEIDYCPNCRGVWLDRGELDKIIERAGQELGQSNRTSERSQPEVIESYHRRDDDDDDNRGFGFGSKAKKKKKGGFLGELFEFGD